MKKKRTFRQLVLGELSHMAALLPYLYMVLDVLFMPHPTIHFLLLGASQMLGIIIVWNQAVHLWHIWTQGPSEPPVRFSFQGIWSALSGRLFWLVC